MAAIAGPEAQVRQATTPADPEAAAEALALAFADDPAWAHLLRDPETRAERLLAYFTSAIESLVPAYREVWVTDDGAGAAVWARPGNWRVPVGVTIREGLGMTRVFGRRLPLAFRAAMRLDVEHPGKPKHWYLDYLGDRKSVV